MRADSVWGPGDLFSSAPPARRTPWFALIALLLLACAMRFHNLGAASLTGDEAFAVRYWAQAPSAVLGQLAGQEPHPFGTFFSFWAWKALAGDSEFAMRMLSALVNLIGVPALYAMTRRLLHGKAVALIAAFLWAINPDLIWHSQEARNYAMWAAISALSFWLLLRASDRNRRIDWVLYVVSATAGLYIFFLEAFMLVVHGLYIFIYRRERLRVWINALIIVGLLLIPWFIQLFALAHSGYHGTAASADLGVLIQQFMPALLFGEGLNSGLIVFLNAFVIAAFLYHLVVLRMVYPRRAVFVVLMITLIPTGLLFVAATRLDVFRPRYLIMITPALLLPFANTAAALGRSLKRHAPLALPTVMFYLVFLLGPFTLLTADSLIHYYSGVEYRNPTDWKGLRAVLDSETTAADAVIMTPADPQVGSTDPAFDYYYRGPAEVRVLPYPKVDTADAAAQLLATHRSVWLIPATGQVAAVESALESAGTLIGKQRAGSFDLRQYRSTTLQPGEIQSPLSLSVGGGQLIGYSLGGDQRSGGVLSVLLYWQTAPEANLKTFVHLIGAPKADGSPLWAQEDHPPVAPGRDVYLIDLTAVPAGTYSIEIGLYEPNTAKRVPVTDGGRIVGDSVVLTSVAISG